MQLRRVVLSEAILDQPTHLLQTHEQASEAWLTLAHQQNCPANTQVNEK